LQNIFAAIGKQEEKRNLRVLLVATHLSRNLLINVKSAFQQRSVYKVRGQKGKFIKGKSKKAIAFLVKAVAFLDKTVAFLGGFLPFLIFWLL
jgi:hypothetical protein